MILELEPEIAAQLEELSEITQRPADELANELLRPVLRQIVDDRDTHMLSGILNGVYYESREMAETVAENVNAIDDALIKVNGKRWVRNVSVTQTKDGYYLDFAEEELVKA